MSERFQSTKIQIIAEKKTTFHEDGKGGGESNLDTKLAGNYFMNNKARIIYTDERTTAWRGERKLASFETAARRI